MRSNRHCKPSSLHCTDCSQLSQHTHTHTHTGCRVECCTTLAKSETLNKPIIEREPLLLATPSESWSFHQRAGHSIRELAIPSESWPFHQRGGHSIREVATPSERWSFHQRAGHSIREVAIPSERWPFHQRGGHSIREVAIPSESWPFHHLLIAHPSITCSLPIPPSPRSSASLQLLRCSRITHTTGCQASETNHSANTANFWSLSRHNHHEWDSSLNLTEFVQVQQQQQQQQQQ
jgi:hypothetical protein